jgi:hypothetical protein
MKKHIDVKLQLTADTPSSMEFQDVYDGLADPWYRFEGMPDGGVNLWANRDGYEWLARVFLKLARSEKVDGYHGHHTLEFGRGPSTGGPELTIGVQQNPDRRPSGAV